MKNTKKLIEARARQLDEASGIADMQKGIKMMRDAINLYLKGAKEEEVVTDKKLQQAYTQYMHAVTDLSVVLSDYENSF